MADDIKIIKQIAEQTGKALKPLPLQEIWQENGYALDNTGQVKRLNLDGRDIKDISFLKDLIGLAHLSLKHNQLTYLTPLSALTIDKIDDESKRCYSLEMFLLLTYNIFLFQRRKRGINGDH